MKRALIARELGDGYGHYPALAFVAERLRAKDWVTALATHNPGDVGAGIEHGLWEVYPAPMVRERRPMPPAVLYSDLLVRAGYDNRETLVEIVDAWIELLRATHARLLIAEHAPAALLAARIEGVPALTMGTGYVCPPPGQPLPFLREVSSESQQEAVHRAQGLLSTMRELLPKSDPEPPAQLGDLCENEPLLFTYAELDPYIDARHTANYLGMPNPMSALTAGATPQWPSKGVGRLFGYFRPDWPGLPLFADTLAASEHACVLHVPGVSSQLHDRLASECVAVSSEPLALNDALETCDVVACHGGHALTTRALLAGCPLVVAPTHLEQQLTADRIAEMGVGFSVCTADGRESYNRALENILNDGDYTERACAFSESHTVTSAEILDARLNPILQLVA